MQIQSDSKPYDDINITPMLDLAYVLLVIFILMCTASVQGLKVALPEGASVAKSLAGQKLQAITVSKDGKFYLNTQQVSLDDLGNRLGAAKAAFPMMQVVVKGDATTNYQGIMDVLNVAGQLGITQVGLATKNAK
jgi:biopolymer transport protein ExbD